MYSDISSFMKIGAVKALLYFAVYILSSHIFHVYCPLPLTLDVRHLHIMPLCSCQFRAIRRSEHRNCLVNVNNITFSRVP